MKKPRIYIRIPLAILISMPFIRIIVTFLTLLLSRTDGQIGDRFFILERLFWLIVSGLGFFLICTFFFEIISKLKKQIINQKLRLIIGAVIAFIAGIIFSILQWQHKNKATYIGGAYYYIYDCQVERGAPETSGILTGIDLQSFEIIDSYHYKDKNGIYGQGNKPFTGNIEDLYANQEEQKFIEKDLNNLTIKINKFICKLKQ